HGPGGATLAERREDQVVRARPVDLQQDEERVYFALGESAQVRVLEKHLGEGRPAARAEVLEGARIPVSDLLAHNLLDWIRVLRRGLVRGEALLQLDHARERVDLVDEVGLQAVRGDPGEV